MQFNKILVAVDDSLQSEEATKAGFELAKQLHAKVALVYAVEIMVPVMHSIELVMPDVDFLRVQSETAEKVTVQLIEKYGKGLDVVKFEPQGSPKDEIISTTERWGADVIVMGTHGRTGLSHLVLGSLSEYVVRHSKIPVLVIPFKEDNIKF